MPHSNPTSTDRQPPKRKITVAEFRAFLMEALDTGSFFIFRRKFYRLGVGKLAALLLQDLINHAAAPNTIRDGEWFLCTTEYLERGDWSVEEQKHHLNKLKEAGFIRLERRGLPARRWAWIDVVKIQERLADISAQLGGFDPNWIGGNDPVKKDSSSVPSEESLQNTTNTDGRTKPTVRDGGPMQPLIPRKELPPSPKDLPPAKRDVIPAEEDWKDAEYLHRGVGGKGKAALRKKWSHKAWAREICLLRMRVGTPRLSRALAWIVANILRDKYVPEVFSASCFAFRFESIEKAMARDLEKNPRLAEVKISPQAQRIASRLRALHWPKDSADQLEKAVQVSLNNLTRFREALARVEQDGEILGRFAKYLLRQLDPGQVVDVHFRDLNPALSKWGNWGGDLVKLAWTPDCKGMKDWGRKAGEMRSANPNLYEQLLEVVKDG